MEATAGGSGRSSRVVDACTNCSTPSRVDPARLAAILRSGRPAEDAAPQMAALFAEVPLGALLGFADERDIPLEALARGYDAVKETYGVRNREFEEWLGYLGVAPPGDAPAGR